MQKSLISIFSIFVFLILAGTPASDFSSNTIKAGRDAAMDASPASLNLRRSGWGWRALWELNAPRTGWGWRRLPQLKTLLNDIKSKEIKKVVKFKAGSELASKVK